MQSRREALKIIGAVGVTCSFPFSANELFGQHVHAAVPEVAQQSGPRFFTAAQFQLLSCLADLIIPATDTPGAVAAGVPQYIDLVVNQDPGLQVVFRDGLEKLDKGGFLQSTEEKQVETLTALSQAADPSFFLAVKNLTADGYYTSRIGLLEELGYNGNDVLAAFPAVTIAEH
jgi:gluconate 2-dehydrogenase gamma chain